MTVGIIISGRTAVLSDIGSEVLHAIPISEHPVPSVASLLRTVIIFSLGQIDAAKNRVSKL